jgi:hypothetical protein
MFGMLSSAYMLTCLNIDYVEDTRFLLHFFVRPSHLRRLDSSRALWRTRL